MARSYTRGCGGRAGRPGEGGWPEDPPSTAPRLANAAAGGVRSEGGGRLGFDVAVVGGTKAGGTPTEAIVLIDKALARRFDARMKHGGQLVSKGRFLARAVDRHVGERRWVRRAAHANAMAAKLAAAMPFPHPAPGRIHGVFVEMDEPTLKRLHA